jgi:hypothetical protein
VTNTAGESIKYIVCFPSLHFSTFAHTSFCSQGYSRWEWRVRRCWSSFSCESP